MAAKFAATGIRRTGLADDGGLELSLTDARGRITTFTLTDDVACALAVVLGEHAKQAQHPAPLTKMPTEFSVGSGTYDDVVLVRFEKDLPYALTTETATELARALVDHSELVAQRPCKALQ